MKKNNPERICANYAKPCPIANKCDNCANRFVKWKFNPDTKKRETIGMGCKKGLQTDGDKRKCFTCTMEGHRCKDN